MYTLWIPLGMRAFLSCVSKFPLALSHLGDACHPWWSNYANELGRLWSKWLYSRTLHVHCDRVAWCFHGQRVRLKKMKDSERLFEALFLHGCFLVFPLFLYVFFPLNHLEPVFCLHFGWAPTIQPGPHPPWDVLLECCVLCYRLRVAFPYLSHWGWWSTTQICIACMKFPQQQPQPQQQRHHQQQQQHLNHIQRPSLTCGGSISSPSPKTPEMPAGHSWSTLASQHTSVDCCHTTLCRGILKVLLATFLLLMAGPKEFLEANYATHKR